MATNPQKTAAVFSSASSGVDVESAVAITTPEIQPGLNRKISNAESVQQTGAKLYAVLGALMLVTLMISLDAMILATALPTITDDFHTIRDVGWYVSAYMICNSALQPLTGKVFTYFDLTFSYLGFVAIFELGSVLCGAAKTSSMLVVGRAVAGIGGSGLMNGAITMLGIAAPPHRRPMLMGLLMSIFGLGQIIGPLIGGVLTQHVSWRWCFWINLPIGAAAAVALVLIRVRNPDQKTGLKAKTFVRQFDIIGFCVFAPACIMLLMALQWGGSTYAWNSATIIGLLVGSVITFAIFGAWESRQGEDAMFPKELIRRPVIYNSCLTAALVSGALFIAAYYLPLWFQAIKRLSPTTSAVYTLPTFGLQIVTVVIAGVLAARVGYFTPFALLGLCLTAIGTGLFSTFNPATDAGRFIGFQILVGAGRGFSIQQPMNAVQASLTGAQMPTGMAIIAWAQFFGAAIFIALGQAAFTSFLTAAIPAFTPNINVVAVAFAGATNFERLAVSEAERAALLAAYNQAIVRVFYLSTGCAVLATFTAMGMGWKRVIKNPGSKVSSNTKGNNKEVEEAGEAAEAKEAKEKELEPSRQSEENKTGVQTAEVAIDPGRRSSHTDVVEPTAAADVSETRNPKT